MLAQVLKDKIVWAYQEAWLRGNVDAFDEVFTPAIVLHLYPFLGIKGLEIAKQGVLVQLQAFSGVRWDPEEIICGGNTMVWRCLLYLKHTGATRDLPVPPTGKELAYKGCNVFHIKDDKIAEIFGYSDYLGMMQ